MPLFLSLVPFLAWFPLEIFDLFPGIAWLVWCDGNLACILASVHIEMATATEERVFDIEEEVAEQDVDNDNESVMLAPTPQPVIIRGTGSVTM